MSTFVRIGSSFWRSTPLDQLATMQGIRPIASIAELNTNFPEGDVFNDVLAELLADRARHRKVKGQRSTE